MGTIYSVACKKCKVTRNLGKFYNNGSEVENREDAMAHAKEIEADSFRPALLTSFMAKHCGHECVFFSDQSNCEEAYKPFYVENGYKEDFDFWKE